MSQTTELLRVNLCYDRYHSLIEVCSPNLRLSNEGQIVYKSRPGWRSQMVYIKLSRRGARIREWLANDDDVFSFFLERNRLLIEVRYPLGDTRSVTDVVNQVFDRLQVFLVRVLSGSRAVGFQPQNCVMYLNRLIPEDPGEVRSPTIAPSVLIPA